MPTPPVGWTKLTNVDDCALRVTSGTVASGVTGTNPFTSSFVSKTASGVNNVSLATSNVVSGAGTHTHASGARWRSGPATLTSSPTYTHPPTMPAPTQVIHTWPYSPTGTVTSTVGGNQGHTHPIATPSGVNSPVTGNTMNFAVNYIDLILGQRN